MIVLVGMIGFCAIEALVLLMIVEMIVVKRMVRWSMRGGRHMEVAYGGGLSSVEHGSVGHGEAPFNLYNRLLQFIASISY